jgi:hypothetical protein
MQIIFSSNSMTMLPEEICVSVTRSKLECLIHWYTWSFGRQRRRCFQGNWRSSSRPRRMLVKLHQIRRGPFCSGKGVALLEINCSGTGVAAWSQLLQFRACAATAPPTLPALLKLPISLTPLNLSRWRQHESLPRLRRSGSLLPIRLRLE